jgi:enduracididine biosynthesis enzyme MppR
MADPTSAGLTGYSLPLSPTGFSSMIPPPPWHFSGDALWVECRVDAAAAAAFLPDGLDLGPDPGRAGVGFFEWQWCTDGGAELRDPVRAQFREFLLALDCRLGDRPVARVPYAWVDRAVPLVRGLVQGMPKLPGQIWLTRSYPVGRAAPRRAAGGVFSAVAAADGRRVASATVTLSGPADGPPPLAAAPLVNTRHLPAWHPGEEPLCELVRSEISGAEFSPVWTGAAELDWHDIGDPDLARLAPIEVGPGFVFSYAETLAPGSRAR